MRFEPGPVDLFLLRLNNFWLPFPNFPKLNPIYPLVKISFIFVSRSTHIPIRIFFTLCFCLSFFFPVTTFGPTPVTFVNPEHSVFQF